MTNTLDKPWNEKSALVIERLKTNSDRGLEPEAISNLRTIYGLNSLVAHKKQGWRVKFLRQFQSPVVLVLIAATVISAVLGEYVDAIAIAAIVFLNACIGFFQESKAEAAIEALKKMSVPKARVLRSGRVQELSSDELVPGDVIVFEAGDFVPADARIIQASQLSSDESVLTGESLPIQKTVESVHPDAPLAERKSMLYGGTAITTGSGRAVITATGMHTEVGKIASLLNLQDQVQTPLQQRLEQVSRKLLWFCAGVVGIVALLGAFGGREWLEIVISAISLAVAAIPEGLPAVVTLALALAVRRMVKKNAVVRFLPAVETLGSVSVICTDKTGTLTTGKMRVREVFTVVDGVKSISDLSDSPSVIRLAKLSCLCSNATLDTDGKSTGDPTEVALLIMARDLKISLEGLRQEFPRSFEWSFDSDRKRMSVAVKNHGEQSVIVKGAPESLIPLCQMSTAESQQLMTIIEELSSKGRRLLAVAERSCDRAIEQNVEASAVERDLTFVGLVSIADPPRVESVEAIEKCKRAGIKVVMITGDHPVTAKAIASELKIVEPNSFDGVLTGNDIEQLSDEQLKMAVTRTAVYARVSPQHKLRIVNAWKTRGETVAMTGDGVNDAPALKAASIGVSMGKGGTEVARQASSMVLADDNFATIVSGIEEGRAIFGNIKRTIQYLLSGNFAEILIMFGAALIGWPVPLAPIHLLWINLVTDGFPALALAAEPVPKNILEEKSHPSERSFLNRRFYYEIGLVGGITAFIALAIYGYTLSEEGELIARTNMFSFLVFAELFRSFASRSDTKTYFQMGPLSNLAHLGAVSFPIVFQFSLHHSQTFNELFKVTVISWRDCLFLLGLAMAPVFLIEMKKLTQQLIRKMKNETTILRSN